SLFFFQAEDGIRDWSVTGVQTCALPIYGDERRDLGVDFGDMVERQALDVGAGPPFVVPEIEKTPYALDREAEIAGAADEAQNARSEERRVGKERRSRRWRDQ